MGEDRMLNIDELKKIFKKNQKIIQKEQKLRHKKEKIYTKMENFAYQLYQDFLKNIDSLNKYEKYFYVHIQDESLFIEELRYHNKYTNIIEFKHISEHRRNIAVNIYLDVIKEDYTSSSVVVNQNQFQILLNNFEVTIRE